MHQLATIFREKISETLKRKSVTTCSRWARAYRVMGTPYPGPWTFKHHPWLEEMHDVDDEEVVGQKAAQMGYTEWALNRAFYKIDVENVDCLYVLPSRTPDATDFSSARFDPALDLSPHLSKMFTDVKNMGHKRSGSANLYIRGAKSKAGLKSIPVGFIAFDEVEEMKEELLTLGELRTAGQRRKQKLYLSTPGLDGLGINKKYMQTTQEQFVFKCPACSRWTDFDLRNNQLDTYLVITAEEPTDPRIKDSFYKCYRCQAKLPHELKADWLHKSQWEPSEKNRIVRGFWIPQLFSPTVTPGELAVHYLKALTSPIDEKELFNSRFGLPKIPEGSRLTDVLINSCQSGYSRLEGFDPRQKLVTMGVDVGGTWNHYEIDQWFINENYNPADITAHVECKHITHGKARTFEELDQLMIAFGVRYCVIDAQPEKRSSLAFANRFLGHVRICYYGSGVAKRDIVPQVENNLAITVDRTGWMDAALGRFRDKTISLPRDITDEYREHLKSPIRSLERDRNGNPVARYVQGSAHDHFAHARTYSEIALPLSLGFGITESIASHVN